MKTHYIDGKWLEPRWWCPLCWVTCAALWVAKQCDRLVDWLDGGDGGDGGCGGCGDD